MPITPVTMYRLTCDRCEREVNDEFYAWLDDSQCIEEALNSDWQEIDGKYYCWECVVWDEENDCPVVITEPVSK